MNLNLYDIKTVQQVMNMFHLTFRKEFGQNFLIDPYIVESIADMCSKTDEDTILEIGPGIGTLTRELAQRHKKVISVEIDHGLIPVLKYTLEDFNNTTVVENDIMKVDLNELLADELKAGPVSVCANLPYYITTPILMKLLESNVPFENITVMIQSEVADRLCAEVGSKNCGAITAVMNYYGKAVKLIDVPADRFVPSPKVDSTVIQIQLHKDKPVKPQDEELFFKTIRVTFEQRRKTLPNALALGFQTISKETMTDIVTSMGLSPDIRGERLTLAQFAELSDRINAILA